MVGNRSLFVASCILVALLFVESTHAGMQGFADEPEASNTSASASSAAVEPSSEQPSLTIPLSSTTIDSGVSSASAASAIPGVERYERNDEGQAIVCWGDSMTSGVGADSAFIEAGDVIYDASYQSYPEILQSLTGIRTYNYGIPGATSSEIVTAQDIGTPKQDGLDSDFEIAIWKRAHPEDILILEIGSNGGWDGNYNTLVQQYQTMIDRAGTSRFIVIGDTDDPGTSTGDVNQQAFYTAQGAGETAWEATLREAFGEHFVNMRVYLIEHGLEKTGLEAMWDDKEDAAYGIISQQLRSDWTHLNSYGYYAQACGVYERGQELGYWN